MPRASYAPVADVRLYARIATIPGVVRAGVRWSNSFDFPNGYRGTVYVVRAADATTILDRSLAILRQGRPGADLGGIEVLPEGAFATFPSMFGLETQADYTARYGPQPGSGTPPRTPLMRVGDPVNTPQS
ncbi:MAG: hypothetical protein ACTHJM_04415 [Marmoricola sp.]